ncbi:MAG: DUF1576 domain-containing protein [Anaerotignaceae bacterium]
MDNIFSKRYYYTYGICVIVIILGVFIGDYRTIIDGMIKIFMNKGILISDYIAIAGVAAAFLNASLTLFFSAFLLHINKVPLNSKVISVLSLMAGFALFGKNVFSMWFILAGTFLLSIVSKEKFSKNVLSGLFASSLSPILEVAYIYNGVTVTSLFLALLVGIVIGFAVPLLAVHTNAILRGLNLYNGGFAVGLVSFLVVPIMLNFDISFDSQWSWSTGNNDIFTKMLVVIALVCILSGFLVDRKNAFKNYLNLLKRPGIASEDFIELDGAGAVLINMGVNLFICIAYIHLIGGDLNGPTLGGIFGVMGFSTNGKHAKNIIPIMFGIWLMAFVSPRVSPTTETLQMAVFMGTTLAPISGTYGFVAGIVVGMIHSAAVLKSGQTSLGANLYNNGFCGGMVSIVCCPILDKFFQKNTFSEYSDSQKPKTD